MYEIMSQKNEFKVKVCHTASFISVTNKDN